MAIPGVDALPSRKKRLMKLKEKKEEPKKRLTKKEKRKLSSILKAKAQKTLVNKYLFHCEIKEFLIFENLLVASCWEQ